MFPILRAAARRQRGLVTREQCFAAGCTRLDLRGLLSPRGTWLVVRRGVYAERAAWERSSVEERVALRDLAAHLTMVTGHVMSHDSAARALGVPLLRPRVELVHVTREGVGGSRTEAGVKHHLTQFPLRGQVEVDGMSVTSLARTGIDLAREHGVATGVGALDHVLRQGVSRHGLHLELEVMRSWPHVTRARRAVELADAGAANLAESLARLLLIDLGFVAIDTQWPVTVGGRVFWTDLRVGCHIIEVDGLQKYLPPEQGGLARGPVREVLREERRRQAAICGEGLGMSRLGWDDLFGRARDDAMERVAREYAVTEQRFGAELPPHLVAQAVEIRRTARLVPA